MLRNRRFAFLVGIFGTCFLGPTGLGSGSERASLGESVHLTILGMNDFHGHVDATDVKVGSFGVGIGGLETVKAYFDAARSDNPHTLVFAPGDIFQGTLLSNWFRGFSIVDALNGLGIDAATFGNHEFDFGQDSLRSLVKSVNFPFITSNIRAKNGSGLPFDPGAGKIASTRIFETGGIKVGVLGLTTPTTPRETMPANVAGIAFDPYAAIVAKSAYELRKAGALVVVVLAHDGGACDMTKPAGEGNSACEKDELTALFDNLPQGTVDVVLAAHTHMAQAHFIRGVPVVQTTGLGQSFSRVDLQVNPRALPQDSSAERIVHVDIARPTFFCKQHFEKYSSCDPDELKKFSTQSDALGQVVVPTYQGIAIQPDPSIKLPLESFRSQIQSAMQEVVSHMPEDLWHDRTRESPTGNCIVDLVKREFELNSQHSVDLMLLNSGGVRRGFSKGDLTLGVLFETLPFDNMMVEAELNGAELDALGKAMSIEAKNVAIVSSGWSVSLRKAFPRHIHFLQNGSTLDAQEMRRVLVPDFVAETNPDIFARSVGAGTLTKHFVLLRDLAVGGMRRSLGGTALPPSCSLQAPLDRTVWSSQLSAR